MTAKMPLSFKTFIAEIRPSFNSSNSLLIKILMPLKIFVAGCFFWKPFGLKSSARFLVEEIFVSFLAWMIFFANCLDFLYSPRK